jgi:alanine-glyoxylate transaminase/serine-glyoxylate transaminase/serine-pyruvate transaminase
MAWDGCNLCAKSAQWYSDTVSAIVVPEAIDARDVIKFGYERYRTSFGTGLSKVMGKVFRIGHLGDLNEVMCLSALASAEMSLRDAGAKVEFGSGVAAAQEWYNSSRSAEIAVAAE